MSLKICTKCGTEYPATTEYFSLDKRRRDGLGSWCRGCRKKNQREYRQTEKGKEHHKRYCQTLNGYLRQVYADMRQRCTNPKRESYKYYGSRGIKCLFTSDEFVDYVKNDLGYDTYDEIKGLQIDRIDNNGNYEPGNIRFVTRSENQQNKRNNINEN